jgi:hypothetical protein
MKTKKKKEKPGVKADSSKGRPHPQSRILGISYQEVCDGKHPLSRSIFKFEPSDFSSEVLVLKSRLR